MARDHHAALNAQVQALGANATQAQRDAVTDANNKLQELLQNQAQLPALTAAEQGQLTELGKQKVKIEGLAREVNSFNKTELESALPKAADVEKIMKYVNEPLAKKIEESDKYNDAEKAKLREVFDTTSRHSPATREFPIVLAA